MTTTTNAAHVALVHLAIDGVGRLTVPGLVRATGLSAEQLRPIVRSMVKDGTLDRRVVREWDKQHGTSWKFGGAGVCQRHRAYFSIRVEVDGGGGLTRSQSSCYNVPTVEGMVPGPIPKARYPPMTLQIALTPKQLKKARVLVDALLSQGVSLQIVNTVIGKDRY